jgi:hypothetical protein
MDKTLAKILLENLLARIVVDPETSQGTIAGVLSPQELEALKLATNLLGDTELPPVEDAREDVSEPPDPDDDAEIDPELQELVEELEDSTDITEQKEPAQEPESVTASKPIRVELNLDSLEFSEPQDPQIRLCLDFGTAMSKAFASEVEEDELYQTFPLKLGQRAAQVSGITSRTIYPVPSSLWITNDGRIHVGEKAIALSLQAQADTTIQRKRFDSLKKELILGLKESSPFNQPMSKEQNPTNVPLSTGEAITFYLGFLIDVACIELQEKYGYSRYVSRNYALPSWPQERRNWGEKMLSDMLNKAQIVADTLHGRWDEGIPVKEVKAVLDKINGLDSLPDYLLNVGITEPLAVASSRLRQEEPHRGLVMIVDIGAGTTDIALFGVVEQPDDGIFNAFPVENGNKSIPLAGDTLDNALRKLIHKRLDMRSSDEHFQRDDQHLQMQLRKLKESLFRDGFCVTTLTNGRIQITIDEFLDTPMVEGFKKEIASTFDQALKSLSPVNAKRYADSKLSVVLTGGGATLPMVQALTNGLDHVHGYQLHRTEVELVPEMFLGDKEIEDVYPQLAVSIGGIMPHIINERDYLPDIDIPEGKPVLVKTPITGV